MAAGPLRFMIYMLFDKDSQLSRSLWSVNARLGRADNIVALKG